MHYFQTAWGTNILTQWVAADDNPARIEVTVNSAPPVTVIELPEETLYAYVTELPYGGFRLAYQDVDGVIQHLFSVDLCETWTA